MDRIVAGAPRSMGWARLVTPLEAICGWANDFSDNEGSFQKSIQLVHVFGLMDTP
jgi:hypothetical protein